MLSFDPPAALVVMPLHKALVGSAPSKLSIAIFQPLLPTGTGLFWAVAWYKLEVRVYRRFRGGVSLWVSS